MQQTVFKQQLPLAIGGDHAGFDYKTIIKKALEQVDWQVDDKGTHSTDSTDYPDYAHPVASMVASDEAAVGILICGSGNGVCMSANKHKGIRAALCWTEELASLARLHNNANILCIPARYVSIETALEMVDIFLSTNFEAGRHERRAEKINF